LLELKDVAKAREKMSFPYGVFSLLYKGPLLADSPISATRFNKKLRKELKAGRPVGG